MLGIRYRVGDVITVGKEIIYRDVHLFCQRLWDIAHLRDEEPVCTNAPTCLRGAARASYVGTLDDSKHNGFRTMNDGLKRFTDALTARFKNQVYDAIGLMLSTTYTTAMARNREDPAAYVQQLIRHAKDSNITSVLNRLMFAFTNIQPEVGSSSRSPLQKLQWMN